MKIIYATNGDEIRVSDCDYSFLSGYSWYKDKDGNYCCNDRETWQRQPTYGKPMQNFVFELMELETLRSN